MTPDYNILLLYVDLFCGMGGTSTGVEQARIGGKKIAKVIACVNHDANAIASHAANHPDARHFTEDIRTLDLTELAAHVMAMRLLYPNAKVVLWASLECTNFSIAKGGQSRDADSRTLANHLPRYVEALSPEYIQIENVKEFMTWGPLIVKVARDKKTGAEYCPLTKKTECKGKKKVTNLLPTWVPDPKFKGTYYREWLAEMTAYGYHFEHRLLNAADFGARTSRRRFFGVFARPELPIIWPETTHSKDGKGGKEKHLPVRPMLDLDNEGESIFGRKKPLAPKTIGRVKAGCIKFVAGGKDAWMIKYNSVNGQTGKHVPPGLDEPCPVVTAQGRLGIAKACFLSRYNSVEPIQTAVSVEGPCGSLTGKDKFSLITPWIMPTSFDNVGWSLDAPAGTLLASRKHQYLLNPQYSSEGGNIDNPCFTLIAWMDKAPPRIVTAETGGKLPPFIKYRDGMLVYEIYEDDYDDLRELKILMAAFGIVDIKMRMLLIPEMLRIMGFPEDYKMKGTETQKKKYIGNAVEVTIACALCAATASALAGTSAPMAHKRWARHNGEVQQELFN